MRNIFALLIAVFVVIGSIIFGNQLALVFRDSIDAGIPISDLLPVVGFNMIRDTPLILSLSFFLAIILAVNRLYKDSEAIVMNSMGIGDRSFMLFIQPIVIVIFLIILYLTNVAIPWSKTQKNAIIDKTENASEFSFIKEGEFQEFKNGKIVFYTSKAANVQESGTQDMEDIFIYYNDNENQSITLASQAQKYTDKQTKNVYLRLIDGKRYYDFSSNKNKKILNFDLYDLQIIEGDLINAVDTYKEIDGQSTLNLIMTGGKKELAEVQ
jgi:lipopolysaccharide export system permease protein